MSLLWFFLGVVFGGFVELVIGILFEDRFRRFYRRLRTWLRHVRTLLGSGDAPPTQSYYTVGRYSVTCVVLEGTVHERLEPQNLKATLSDEELVVPDPLVPLVDRVRTRQLAVERARGQPTFFNGPMVALQGWSRGRAGTLERPALTLRFCSTDYYTFLATAINIDELVETADGSVTVRDLYVTGRDYRDPNPLIATSFGVNLAVVTRDNFTMFVKRGVTGLSNYLGRMAVPVGESVHPVLDGDRPSSISLFRTAQRGAREELNLDIGENEVHYFTLAVDTNYYFYGLTGAIFCEDYGRDDIVAHASIGAKDAWEAREAAFVRFEPQAVARFLSEAGGPSCLTPSSFVSVTQALVSLYGERSVFSAFGRVS